MSYAGDGPIIGRFAGFHPKSEVGGVSGGPYSDGSGIRGILVYGPAGIMQPFSLGRPQRAIQVLVEPGSAIPL